MAILPRLWAVGEARDANRARCSGGVAKPPATGSNPRSMTIRSSLFVVPVLGVLMSAHTSLAQTGIQYDMNYGPCLAGTIEGSWPANNVALKGVAIRIGDDAGVLFDTELLRMAAGWTDGFLELTGTPYDGKHGPHSRVRGNQVFGTSVRPGWASRGDFADPREIPHGPLPRSRARYRGLYLHGSRVVLSYQIDGREVLECPALEVLDGVRVITRTFEVGPSPLAIELVAHDWPGQPGGALTAEASKELGGPLGPGRSRGAPGVAVMQHDARASKDVSTVTAIGVIGAPAGARWSADGDSAVLEVPPGRQAVRFKVAYWAGAQDGVAKFVKSCAAAPQAEPLAPLTRGGPPRWRDVHTQGHVGSGDGAYVVDTLTVPYDNPWKSRMRIAGLDFFSDGRAAVSTWNGDVWVISGIDTDLQRLTWRRFATGLFSPLGLKIVDDVVHTLGRDQITRLHDLNGDGEADHYECFNNDVLITENFHEFSFDLQTDPEGNFYFSKGGPVRPGGRGFDKILGHHGCVLKVSQDGSQLSVYATGLRAPNGIGVGPDGQVTSGDNEGTWTPRCRLNWIKEGTFCGCMDTAHRSPAPAKYDLPVCWMPMEVDNSSGGQVWVTSPKWGPFQGGLLHLSYGTSSLFKVLLQEVDGVVQGGVARFPLTFASSCMRGRFNPVDQQLYICGLKGWQTNAAKLAAVQRVRYTGRPANMPTGLEVYANGVAISFTDPLDREMATDADSYAIEQWNYAWTERYGSPELSTLTGEEDLRLADDKWNSYKNHDVVAVDAARLSADGKTVFLEIAGVKPVMQMRVRYDLDAANGDRVRGDVHHSIHVVPDRDGPVGQ